MVNFVTALIYHFFLALPAAFTQPGNHLFSHALYPKVMMVPLCSYWPNDNFEHGIPFVKLRGAHGKLGGKEHQI